MTRDSALSLPVSAGAHSLADWAEALMLVEQRNTVSRSSLRNRLRDVLGSDEAELDLIYGEVRRRANAAPGIYPFRVTGSRLELAGGDSRIYSYLLVLALEEAPFRRTRRFARVELGLDLLALEALKAYLGNGAVGVRFAWPPLKEDDHRPTNFGAAVDWLADKLDRPTGTGQRSPRKKDGGVDVVAWRPFRDRQSAFLVILGQTTVGVGYVSKAKDIRPHQWNEWIPLGVPPLTAIVVPHSVPATSDAWDDMHYDVNLILDRLRLCELLEGAPPLAANVVNAIATWAGDQLDGLAV